MRRADLGGRHLAGAAVALAVAAAAAGAYSRDNPNSLGAGLATWVAVMLLLELPAFWWRRRGGGIVSTLLAAAAGPLLVLEGLLAYSAWHNRHVVGDLQGIEQILMVVVLLPILVTAAAVAWLAVALVEPAEPPG